jgi:DUF917 family protein
MQEKEKEKRLKKRKKQVMLMEPEITEETVLPLAALPAPIAKEEKIEQGQQLPEDKGYIYVW